MSLLFSQNDAGAYEPQPTLLIAGAFLQPPRQTLDHLLNQFFSLIGWQSLYAANVLKRRLRRAIRIALAGRCA